MPSLWTCAAANRGRSGPAASLVKPTIEAASSRRVDLLFGPWRATAVQWSPFLRLIATFAIGLIVVGGEAKGRRGYAAPAASVRVAQVPDKAVDFVLAFAVIHRSRLAEKPRSVVRSLPCPRPQVSSLPAAFQSCHL
jgi:hypothetical protein